MRVAIVTNDRTGQTYRTRELLRRLRRRGVHYNLLVPEYTVVRVRNGNIQVINALGRPVRPDVVLNALYVPSGKGLEIVECFEAMGVPVVNRAQAWRRAKIKPLSTVLFGVSGVEHPPTVFSDGAPRYAGNVVQATVGLPAVFKPWRGALGFGIVRVRGWHAVYKQLRNTLHRRRPVYLQQFVRNPGRDIRVMVIGDQAVGATYRIAPPGHWKTNVAAGGRPARCPVTKELADISIRATASVGLDIAGVDVIEGPRGPEVLEVNAWPNYRRFDKVAGVDVADRIAQFLIQQARRPGSGPVVAL
ncbi:MAG: RimK family alpha-L-glutamate ligase [Firmicutes bacterium]|nr:RimK family alpha-L-glutamate ligase [Bacillota bacterium]